jgi:hypothetical protein
MSVIVVILSYTRSAYVAIKLHAPLFIGGVYNVGIILQRAVPHGPPTCGFNHISKPSVMLLMMR